MKQKALFRRGLALLLTLALLAGAVPAALAAETCPKGGSHTVTEWSIIRAANCHEIGTRRGVCTKCGSAVYEDIPIDPTNHDAIYTDNNDGLTHSFRCLYDGAVSSKELHDFEDGRCIKCMAVDYNQVKISLPERTEQYVDLNDASASLSMGDVRLTVGSADITDEYTLSCNWYYQGSLVGSGETYPLPASFTAAEADYEYVCFILATAKNGSGKSISASCTIAVHVRELIEAYAVVGTEDSYFTLGATNSRTGVSAAEQIYNQVYALSDSYPSYVIFADKPASKVGQLNVTAGIPYDFSDKSNSLSRAEFVPDKTSTGAYVINFTAYDSRGAAYPGTLTITVEQSLGSMDVLYTTTSGAVVNLQPQDFDAFWRRTYPQGALTRVSFTTLPSTTQGALYTGYTSASRPGVRVKAQEYFYLSPTAQNQSALSGVTFVPGSRYTGCVTIPFEAYGQNNRNVSTYLFGNLCVFVNEGAVQSVNYAVTAGGTVKLREADFLAVYQAFTGAKDAGFYIQLLDVPAYGSLYLNYTGSPWDAKLTAANVSSYPLYCGAQTGGIGSVTYLSGSGLTESVRYVAYSTRGALLYVGTISFGRGDLSVSYTAGISGVSFASSDFETALGLTAAAATGTYLTFTPPTQGSLTYTRTGSAGVSVTANDKYYLGTDLTSVSNLRYTPKAGQTGTVSIPFTVCQPSGVITSGTVKITVRTAYTKSFTDVTSGQWFYTYVMDLAEAGIIDGTTPTTYQPDGEVTYGQALKLIMLASGYAEQAPTGKNWASGYLTAAVRDGLLPSTVTESYLDRKIDRYTIATVAAKAMRLPLSTLTSSPFSDMGMTEAAAPYVLALYEAKILEGTTLSNGKVMFYGVNSIRRSEMAAIVWRINNYKK